MSASKKKKKSTKSSLDYAILNRDAVLLSLLSEEKRFAALHSVRSGYSNRAKCTTTSLVTRDWNLILHVFFFFFCVPVYKRANSSRKVGPASDDQSRHSAESCHLLCTDECVRGSLR
jgi:hypothetical protein